jgi:hypothetical protein
MAFTRLFNEAITGTTTDNYPTDPQYQNERIGQDAKKYMIVKNLGANGLTYRVKVKDGVSDSYRTLLVNGNSENNVATGNYDEFLIDGNYQEIAVEIKAQISPNQTDFEVVMNSRGNRGT